MSSGEVDDVDVVTDARAIRGIVVVTEDAQLLADPRSRLREVGDEVLRDTQWELPDERRGMSPDRIEVAQADDLVGGSSIDDIT